MTYRKQKTRLSAFEVCSYWLWGMKSNGTKMYVATAIPANDKVGPLAPLNRRTPDHHTLDTPARGS